MTILLLFLALPLIGGEVPCSWDVLVSSTQQLGQEILHLYDNSQLIEITNTVKALNVFSLQQSSSEKYYAYPYNVQIGLTCQEQDNQLMERSLMFAGDLPRVTICSESISPGNRASICRMADALVLDLTQHNDSVHCEEVVCHPTWMVPIQWREEAFHLTVDVDSGANYIKPVRVSLYLSGYEDILETHSTISTLDPDPPTLDILHIPHKSPCLIFGPFGNSQTIYITHDEFNTAQELKADILGITGDPLACDCFGGSPHIIQTAVLIDRLLILTQSGLYEIFGNFTFDDVSLSYSVIGMANLTWPACASKLYIPIQSVAFQQSVLLTGACQNSGIIYSADVVTRKAQMMHFRDVVDVNGIGSCESLSNVSSCEVVRCVHSALDQGVIFCLLQTTDSGGPVSYKFLGFRGSPRESSWQLLSTIPSSLEIPSDFKEPLSVAWLVLNSGTLESIQLTGVTIMHHVSRHVYLTGSHIFHSQDAGKSFYLLPWDSSSAVKLSVVGEQGIIVLCTEDNQLWVSLMQLKILRLIYPSTAWDAVHAMHGYAVPSNLKVISMFFDTHEDDLQLMMLDGGSVTKHTVPLGEILQHQAIADHWANIHTWTSSADHMGSPCQFSGIYFETPSRMKYTRTMMYDYSPPTLHGEQRFHSDDSILISHAIYENLQEALLLTGAKEQTGIYGDGYIDTVEKWRAQLNRSQPYFSFLYHNNLMGSGIHIDLDGYHRIYHSVDDHHDELPDVIYLGNKQDYNFSMYLTAQYESPNYDPLQSMAQLGVSVQVTNPELLAVRAVRQIFPFNHTVKYEINVRDKGEYLRQKHPGIDLYPSSIIIDVWNSHLACFMQDDYKVIPQGLSIISVQVGCGPSKHVIFDWQSSFDRLMESDMMELPFDCIDVDPELPCFYFSNVFYPYFNIADDTTGEISRYQGNYTLKIVGGGSTFGGIQIYSEDQCFSFNKIMKSSSEQSLIMGPTSDAQPLYDGWPVYNHLQNRVSWFCETNSPCSNVEPRFPSTPEYYFIMEFSNMVVGLENSYCDLTQKFLIHVHGLPISSSEMTTILTSVSIVLVCCQVALYYYLHRNKSKNYERLKTYIRSYIKKSIKIQPDSKDESGLPEWAQQLRSKYDQVVDENSSRSATIDSETASDRGLSDKTASPPSDALERDDQTSEVNAAIVDGDIRSGGLPTKEASKRHKTPAKPILPKPAILPKKNVKAVIDTGISKSKPAKSTKEKTRASHEDTSVPLPEMSVVTPMHLPPIPASGVSLPPINQPRLAPISGTSKEIIKTSDVLEATGLTPSTSVQVAESRSMQTASMGSYDNNNSPRSLTPVSVDEKVKLTFQSKKEFKD